MVDLFFHSLPENLRAGLRQAASDSGMANLESVLGLPLPLDLREAFAHHDGQTPTGPALFGAYRWLGLAEVAEEWRIGQRLLASGDLDALSMGDVGDAVRLDWWNPNWIPFARSMLGDLLCIDMAPGSAGHAGQVISVFHDDDARDKVADGFAAYLGRFVMKG